ncbi:MAG: hypothetical protein H6920_06230 [Sphingomonadaceae bacterium]|nr:hypothetical protein [Sphingomonadaceae bacterium]MCP5383323.1 hypothetical protein [Altererythrobacter sp.]MCP5391201.1 hypothetical protein [Sphingomonadaceae bacterium]MCP5393500.1 hypothetical protein [Sphingomonadaceae bacterium]
MKKLFSLLAVLVLYGWATPASALPCDDRGSNWAGTVQIGAAYYNFELRRQTCDPGSFWNFYLTPTSGGGAPSQGQVTVSLIGSTLTVTPVAGTPTGCPLALSGTYARRDVTNGIPYRGSGTATCGAGPTGVWRATIR